MVQWLRFRDFKAEGVDLTSNQGTKIQYTMWYGQKVKSKTEKYVIISSFIVSI